MGEIIRLKRPKLSQRHKNRSLCVSGFHKWELLVDRRFDVKKGKLVSAYRCVRCGVEKNEAI